ncbi:MAG: hypothetical protein HYX39_06375 [Bacteroidetes bacterium]|nr:hypothetical protein [Bacteroidota bacterium]
MKKTIVLFLLCFSFTQFVYAQNKKIFVSKHGGKRQVLTLGKRGYNYYHYSNYLTNNCDTLICNGKGFELCKIDKNMFMGNNREQEMKYLKTFNKAIKTAEKYVRRSKNSEGQFSINTGKEKLSIKYFNAGPKGDMDMLIEVL